MVISPENFTTTLLSYGIIFSDDKLPAEKEKFIKSVRMYTEMFTDIALQSTEIQRFPYSIQSLSAVVAARKAKGMKPEWSPHFEKISGGYCQADIQECFYQLYKRFERIKQKKKADQSK